MVAAVDTEGTPIVNRIANAALAAVLVAALMGVFMVLSVPYLLNMPTGSALPHRPLGRTPLRLE
jgi:hypothetical protein